MVPVRRLAPLLPLLALVAACGGGSAPGAAQPAATSPGASSHAGSTPGPATVSKVLVVVVENHSLGQEQAGMPWLDAQATRYAYADDYHALTHPSEPNYLAIAGGTTGGVTDDRPPSDNAVPGPSVFDQALAHGRTAGVYADAMPGPCATTDSGRYAVRHNPWAFHPGSQQACRAHDLPLDALAGDVAAGHLPDVGMVVPDLCHDAHDCGLPQADAWLQETLGPVLAGPDFTSGRLAVVVTADEDDHHDGNRVLTAVLHRSLDGQVVHDPLTHLSLSRSLSEVGGATALAEAQDAPPLLEAFGLRPA